METDAPANQAATTFQPTRLRQALWPIKPLYTSDWLFWLLVAAQVVVALGNIYEMASPDPFGDGKPHGIQMRLVVGDAVGVIYFALIHTFIAVIGGNLRALARRVLRRPSIYEPKADRPVALGAVRRLLVALKRSSLFMLRELLFMPIAGAIYGLCVLALASTWLAITDSAYQIPELPSMVTLSINFVTTGAVMSLLTALAITAVVAPVTLLLHIISAPRRTTAMIAGAIAATIALYFVYQIQSYYAALIPFAALAAVVTTRSVNRQSQGAYGQL